MHISLFCAFPSTRNEGISLLFCPLPGSAEQLLKSFAWLSGMRYKAPPSSVRRKLAEFDVDGTKARLSRSTASELLTVKVPSATIGCGSAIGTCEKVSQFILGASQSIALSLMVRNISLPALAVSTSTISGTKFFAQKTMVYWPGIRSRRLKCPVASVRAVSIVLRL